MKLTLFCEHSLYIGHLEAELAWLKQQLLHERARAEAAVDRLLAGHAIGPIAPPLEPPRDEAVAALLRDAEFTGAGEVR